MSVSAVTGQVTVANPIPPAVHLLRNFIVECIVTEGASRFVAKMRIHIHLTMTDFWVTPVHLDVPLGAKNMRFSVLARFDDVSLGDITNWAPFETPTATRDETFVQTDSAPRRPMLTWSTDSPGSMDVDTQTGVLSCSSIVVAGAQITANLDGNAGLPLPATRAKSGTADGTSAWTTAVTLKHLDGPGIARMSDDDVQNFLFLPDGFEDTAADEAAFERLARSILGKLLTKSRLRPWDLLDGKLNFFAAWLPSREAGISILNEVEQFNKAHPNAEAREFDQPQAATGVGPWSLAEMIHEVGLPVPFDDPDGNPLGTAAAGRLKGWIDLYPGATPPAPAPAVPPSAATTSRNYPAWLALNDRLVLNERATRFHTAMGERPAAEILSSQRSMGFNPLRHSEEDFDDFLGQLEAGGVAVGSTWQIGNKDHGNIMILCRTQRNGGANGVRSRPGNANEGRIICVSLGGEREHRITVAPTGGFDIRPDSVPRRAGIDLWTTAAHEFSHSMTLDDEYGDEAGGDLADTPDNRAEVDRQSNIQMRATLLTGGNLDANLVKWRWPRIVKAGVLAAPPEDLVDRFRIQLQPGHTRPFIADTDPRGRQADIVKLRVRPLVGAPPASGRFKVIDKADPFLDIEAIPGTAIVPGNFPPGSLLIAPKRAPDPDPANDVYGDDLELISEAARNRINTTRNPLNANDGDPANRACTAAGVNMQAGRPTASSNWPAGGAPNPPRYSSWIVGLYEGGLIHDCNVYHPTGVCLMRTQTYSQPQGGGTRAYQFCPVCRYAIVDLLDPTLHGRMDREYEPRYPT